METDKRGIAVVLSVDDLLVLHQAVCEFVIFGGQLNDHTPKIMKDHARDLLTIVSDTLISELADIGHVLVRESVRTLTNSTLELDTLKGTWGKGDKAQ